MRKSIGLICFYMISSIIDGGFQESSSSVHWEKSLRMMPLPSVPEQLDKNMFIHIFAAVFLSVARTSFLPQPFVYFAMEIDLIS